MILADISDLMWLSVAAHELLVGQKLRTSHASCSPNWLQS